MWFFFVIFTTVMWGVADLFYKKGADGEDRYSHLKTTMTVGFAMGLYATYMITLGGVDFHPVNLLVYLPVSVMYILSMAIGYFGLRYLDLSISSPIQNASGAVSALLCFIFLRQVPNIPTAAAIAVICIGVFMLGVFEKQSVDECELRGERKYRIGIVAFFMPILYCVIDSLGTFFDAYYLDDFATTPLKYVTEENYEDVANVAYMYTFLAVALAIFVFLKFKKVKFFYIKEDEIAVKKIDANRMIAAAAETAGQVTYVYALSGSGVVAGPVIASYCIVSMLLSRIILKEKLTLKQYVMIALVIAGIITLGVIDGINGDL